MPTVSFRNPDEQKRFIKFAIVGASGSVVDFGVFNLLSTLFGLTSTIAQAVSFTLAVINNFIWNRLWTYPETRKSGALKPFIQFGFVNVIGLGIRTVLFMAIEPQMITLSAVVFPGINHPEILGHNLTLALVILIVMLWNYFANRYWTFKEVDAIKKQAE